MLTDRQIQSLKAQEKTYKVFDGGGLFLEVTPTGSKRWRYKYRFEGREKLLALGVYPEVTLKDARDGHAEARKLLAGGVDPSAAKKARKATESGADSFATIAREWLDKFAPSRAASYTKSLEGRLRLHILPWIGSRPVDAIKPQELLEVARRIEAQGRLETAHRVLELAGQIFNYAIQTARAEINPALPLKAMSLS